MDPEGNVIVVENGDWQRYYWHWADRRILDMLIGGPELARRHVATFHRCAEGEWAGVYPPYSGAVIDFDRSRLLFFGDDLMAEMPHRRAMLKILPGVWAGFEVGWAYGGMSEIADMSVSTSRGRGGIAPRLSHCPGTGIGLVSWCPSSRATGVHGSGR
ncbi:MAG: hypothetical protein U1C73_22425 [Dietzia sp.]|nr:hypothetical protein [Dietzia sp.]